MNAHVSSILLGVRDMEKSKRFYTEGLGWKIQQDYRISVFFVQHGGSLVGFYGRDGLAAQWARALRAAASAGSFSTTLSAAKSASTRSWRKPRRPAPRSSSRAAALAVGRVRRFLRGPGRLHLEHRLQRPREGPALRGVAAVEERFGRGGAGRETFWKVSPPPDYE